MIDSKLVAFFQEGLTQGLSKESLVGMLKEKGWRQDDIQEAYLMVTEQQPPGNKLAEMEARLAKLEERVFGAVEVPVPVAAPAPPVKVEAEDETSPPSPKIKEEKDWESMLGGNWMVKIGVTALVLGVGFFLKLAFDNEWIDETGRIALGVVGGLILLGLGEFWRKKYAVYAQILTGGGIAILYFTVYAAHAFYGLIGVSVGFGAMALVTIAAGVLALRSNTSTVAVLGVLGGFFTPFMFVKSIDELTLMIYVFVLDLGVLALSTVRNWRPLTLLSLVGSILLFAYWYGQFYEVGKFEMAESFITTIFLIFAFATVLWHFIWNKRAEGADLVLITLNAAVYFGVSYVLIQKVHADWLGLFTFSLAAFYGVLAYIAFVRSRSDGRIALFLGGISLLFLTIGIPIQLDKNWITIAWSAEAITLVGLGFLIASRSLRVAGLVAFALAGVRLLTVDMGLIRGQDFTPFWNDRFFTAAIVIGTVLLASFFYRLWHSKLSKDEHWLFAGLLLVGGFFTAIEMGVQLEHHWITIAWAVEGLILVLLGFGLRAYVVRGAGIIMFLLVAIRLLLFDTKLPRTEEFTLFWNDRFLAFLVSIAVIYIAVFLYRLYHDRAHDSEKGILAVLLLSANFLTLWILSSEAVSYFDGQIRALRAGAGGSLAITGLEQAKNFSLSAIWAVYSVLLVVVGIFKRVRVLRIAGLVLFWITILKVFLIDVFGIGGIYRVASLMSLGVILVVTGYLYHRFQDRIKEFLATEEEEEGE